MVKDVSNLDLGLYTEYMIEYSNDENIVYISGLDLDLFWQEILIEEDIAEPQSYAEGFQDALKTMGIFSTVSEVEFDD